MPECTAKPLHEQESRDYLGLTQRGNKMIRILPLLLIVLASCGDPADPTVAERRAVTPVVHEVNTSTIAAASNKQRQPPLPPGSFIVEGRVAQVFKDPRIFHIVIEIPFMPYDGLSAEDNRQVLKIFATDENAEGRAYPDVKVGEHRRILVDLTEAGRDAETHNLYIICELIEIL